MNEGKSKLTVIQKRRKDGLYVWLMDNGETFKDDRQNVMNIPAQKGDIEAMGKITKAARYYGAPDGKPHFMPGSRRVSEEEYSVQRDRMKQGLIPDELDLGAWADAARGLKKHGNE
jgi:hypothetical protein